MTAHAAPERKWITKVGLASWIAILAVWNVAGWALYWWSTTVDLPLLGAVPLVALLFMAGAAAAEVVGANFAIEVERANHAKDYGRMWANIFCAVVFAAINAYGSHNAYEEFLVRPAAAKAEIARTAALDASTARLAVLDARIAAVPPCDPLTLGPKALVECGVNRRQEIAAVEAERRAEQARHDSLPSEAEKPSPWMFWGVLAFFAAVEAVKMLSFWSIGAGRHGGHVPKVVGQSVQGGTPERSTDGTVVPFVSKLPAKPLFALALSAMALMGWTRGTPAVAAPVQPPVEPERQRIEDGTGLDAGISITDDDLDKVRTLRERRVPWREIQRITGIPKSTAFYRLKRAKSMTPLQGEAA